MACTGTPQADGDAELGERTEAAAQRNSAVLKTTHLFVELTSLDELSFPTSSSRIKYTCLDASPRYLAVGSSSGTVYLFSRYASKYRHRLSSVPVQVFPTKDGAVAKLLISPDEKYVACASQRGPLTVCALSTNGHSPSTLITNTYHTRTDEAGQANYITELCWSGDSKKVFAGDVKGQVSCTRIQSRNLFRSPCEVLLETDTEIVEIDVCNDSLLVSTLTRCCLCDLKTLNCVQVGKKLRHGRFGAIFYPPDHSPKLVETPTTVVSNEGGKENGRVYPQLIFACRPNGRLWEANGRGVVYSTHQYRNVEDIVRLPVVSFKSDFIVENAQWSGNSKGPSFGRLHVVECEQSRYLLANDGSTFSLIDPSDGRLALVCDVDNKAGIDQYAVCGSDVFILCGETGNLRKLSLFSLQKAVEKLHWRRCFTQAAQVLFKVSDQIESDTFIPWRSEILKDILDSVNEQCRSKPTKAITEAHIDVVQRLHEQSLKQRGRRSGPSEAVGRHEHAAVRRLNTGIHRVVRIMDNSGYEDDFTFRAPSPLRLRSKSTPNMDGSTSLKPISWKRQSLPLKGVTTDDSMFEESGEVDENAEDRRKKLIQQAFQLLTNAEAYEEYSLRAGSAESLKTLLGCDDRPIDFDSQVTLGDVPKELATAKKVLRLIADVQKTDDKCTTLNDRFSFEAIPRVKKNLVADFSSLFGRKDPLEGMTKYPAEILPCNVVSVDRLRCVKKTGRGARIVKAIKPFGRPISKEVIDSCGSSDLKGNQDSNLNSENPEAAEREVTKSTVSEHLEEITKGDSSENVMDTGIVVENNFITEKNIKMSWKEPSEGEGTDEQHEDFDTGEYYKEAGQAATTTCNRPFARSLQVGEVLSDRCERCGTHESWLNVMAFGPAMSQLKVITDEFEIGGVPSTVEQWAQFFTTYLQHSSNVKGHEREVPIVRPKKMCDECSSYFKFCSRIEGKITSLCEAYTRAQEKGNAEVQKQPDVRRSVLSWPSTITKQFFKHPAATAKGPSLFASSGLHSSEDDSDVRDDLAAGENSCSTFDVDRVRAEAENEVRKKSEKKLIGSRNFSSLYTLKLSQLLYCMRLCEGVAAVFDLLKKNEELANSLTNDDWCWLMGIKAGEEDRWKEVMPRQMVTDVLSELDITSIRDVGPDLLESTNEHGRRLCGSSKRLAYSIVINVDGNCPCCTLPVKTRVSDTDCTVSAFHCGHLYHKVCLREANIIRCARCEAERRRLLQQGVAQNLALRSVRAAGASVSNSGNIGTTRHIPVKAARVNVTLPPSLKVVRRT